MGNNSSQIERRRPTSSASARRSSQLSAISKKIDEKEYVFIALQAETDKAILGKDQAAMESLTSEITAHIMDLNQLQQIQLPTSQRRRSQKVIHNFEILLAKLKSIVNSDTAVMNKNRLADQGVSTFYTNDPDIVSDVIRFNEIRKKSVSASNSIILDPSEQNEVVANSSEDSLGLEFNTQKVLTSIETEINVLSDQVNRTSEDINQYYQIDKAAFYLQVKLKDIEVSYESVYYEQKFKLTTKLGYIRHLLDKKAGELEEQRVLLEEVNTLEILVDSATTPELRSLQDRCRKLQETVEKIVWSPEFTVKKIDILSRLARILERIAYTTSPAASLRDSVEHLYGNINSLRKEMDMLKTQEELESIKSIDEAIQQFSDPEGIDDEELYGNVEVIRQNLPQIKRSVISASQRGTVYVNADIVRQNSDNGSRIVLSDIAQPFHKRPLPLPRNYDEKIINDLPKYWQRLNEICDNNIITDLHKTEVREIQNHAEIARNLFERKINEILDKAEESIDL